MIQDKRKTHGIVATGVKGVKARELEGLFNDTGRFFYDFSRPCHEVFSLGSREKSSSGATCILIYRDIGCLVYTWSNNPG